MKLKELKEIINCNDYVHVVKSVPNTHQIHLGIFSEISEEYLEFEIMYITTHQFDYDDCCISIHVNTPYFKEV